MRARYRRDLLIEAWPRSGQDTRGTARSRAQLASAHRLEVSGVDGEAIAPLVLREAPHGNVLTEEARHSNIDVNFAAI